MPPLKKRRAKHTAPASIHVPFAGHTVEVLPPRGVVLAPDNISRNDVFLSIQTATWSVTAGRTGYAVGIWSRGAAHELRPNVLDISVNRKATQRLGPHAATYECEASCLHADLRAAIRRTEPEPNHKPILYTVVTPCSPLTNLQAALLVVADALAKGRAA